MAKKKQKNLARRKAIAGYLFITPFIIGFLFFMVKPLCESFMMSLSKVTVAAGQGGFKLDFWGIKNYKDAFLVDAEYT